MLRKLQSLICRDSKLFPTTFGWLTLAVLHAILFQPTYQQRFTNTNAFRSQRVWRPEEIFPANYNNQQAPIANLTSALDVEVSLHIHDIRLSDNKDSLLIDAQFSQLWVDDRLVSPPAIPPTSDTKLTLDYRWKQAFWTPQLQFTNGRTVQLNQLIEPLIFLSVSGRNRVQMTARLTIETTCDSHISSSDSDNTQIGSSSSNSRRYTSGSYPFDRRECILQLISMSSPVETVALRWKQFEVASTRVSGFSVSPGRTEHCISRLQDASYACLRARFRLRRSVGSVWTSVFVPGLVAALLGYLSVWFPLHSLYIQPRASVLLIAIAIILAQLVTLSVVKYPLAQTNHSSSIRSWLLICLSFTLIALIEFVLAIYHQTLRHALVRQLSEKKGTKDANGLTRNATIALRNRSQPMTTNDTIRTNGSNAANNNHNMPHIQMNQMPGSGNNVPSDLPIDDNLNGTHLDGSISNRLFSKLLLLNRQHNSEKEEFESVWLDQLLKILYPAAFVVITIIYFLVNI